MEVKKEESSQSLPVDSLQRQTAPSRLVKEFWPRYKKRGIVITIAMQAVITLAIGWALVVAGVSFDSLWFTVCLSIIFILTSACNILLFDQLSLPLKNLADALTHVSGEPTVVTPPNPNAKHFQREGLKPLLQLIYETAAGAAPSKKQDNKNSQDGLILKTGLDQSQAGVVILDTKQTIIFANKLAPVKTGQDNKRHLSLIFDDDRQTLDEWIQSCNEHAVHAEKLWLRVANALPGEEGRRIYDINASYQKGSAAEIVLVFFDRTNVYQSEDDDLDFISFAAHELRGPITVIRGYIDVIDQELHDQMDAEQQELMKRLTVSANRLSGYINNILNASKYDRRHLRIHLAEDSLFEIYDTIHDDMQLRASSQNRFLNINIPKDLPPIAADRGSLSEVFANLIDNAIKYSYDGGSVTVSAVVDKAAQFVTVTVEDRGVGMPGNVVSNLFHKFYRSHRSRETVAGTGIGLYLSKAIIESHGGQISVRSTEGRGSTFSFSVPIYATVADKLQTAGNNNESFIGQGGSWIKNHSMFKG